MSRNDEMTTTVAAEIDLEPLCEVPLKGKPLVGSALPFLNSVKVRVSVRIGDAELSVAELLKLETDSVLSLDRLVEQPLDVLVDEHVVARGMLVAIGDHFGVRITEKATVSTAGAVQG